MEFIANNLEVKQIKTNHFNGGTHLFRLLLGKPLIFRTKIKVKIFQLSHLLKLLTEKLDTERTLTCLGDAIGNSVEQCLGDRNNKKRLLMKSSTG
jgi:hypothetical protein